MSLSLRLKSFLVGLLIVTLLLTLLTRPFASHAQNPTTVESDDPRVFQNGTWSNQTAPAASNGNYLFSSGDEADILGLSFVGSAIEIIYVSGPQFGTLSIEIDGTVVRTVITTAEKIEYGQVAQIDYLSDGPHSLKAYAQAGGVIAVDAFRISPIVGDGPVPSQVMPTSDDGGIQSSFCAPPNAIHRVSLTSTGTQSTADSFRPSISDDGRYVAFTSDASLVPGDGDSFSDVYVYDRLTCAVRLVSVSSTRVKGNDDSYAARIAGNGRIVVFQSLATNLVPNDTNGLVDVFVHDQLISGNTLRVSVATGGTPATGGASTEPSISPDGRYVAFQSSATNLVPSDTNGLVDVFVNDRQTSTTTRVSVATGGVQATGGPSSFPDITPDGRYVTFRSSATNLVAGDTNAVEDIFVHDRQTTTTTRVSVATAGTQGNNHSDIPFISADGRFVAFYSIAENLVTGDTNSSGDVFVHDRQTSTTTRVSVATNGTQAGIGGSFPYGISADGRFIVFVSSVINLVPNDTNGNFDTFVHDRQTNTTTRVSVAAGGIQGTGGSVSLHYADISADGRYIAFGASFTNLVTGDTNGQVDIFVTPRVQPVADTLALIQPGFAQLNLLNSLADNPPHTAYTAFSAYAPITGGQWVMGDWNGDGLKTPGVYANGPFYYTNKASESQPSDWFSLWIGVPGMPVAGRFNEALTNDCIGAVQQASSGGQTVFVLYFACNLTGTTTPAIASQWLSAVLPDSGGFSGVHQFGAGDFNSDGVDSIAVRRGTFIAFGNVPPATGPAAFDLAQFIGTPQAGPDAGIFVVGNWDNDVFDSFGLFYQNGEFFFRNDLLFNSGAFGNQSVGQPFAGTVQATTWR